MNPATGQYYVGSPLSRNQKNLSVAERYNVPSKYNPDHPDSGSGLTLSKAGWLGEQDISYLSEKLPEDQREAFLTKHAPVVGGRKTSYSGVSAFHGGHAEDRSADAVVNQGVDVVPIEEKIAQSGQPAGDATVLQQKGGGYRSRYQLGGVPTNLNASDTANVTPIQRGQNMGLLSNPQNLFQQNNARQNTKTNAANLNQQQTLLRANQMQEKIHSATPPPQMGPRMFQGGGMYADNTVQSAGQGSKGSTSNIVYQEQNPELQDQRLQGLQNQQEQEASLGSGVTAKTDVMEKNIDPLAQQAFDKSQAKFATGEMIGGTIAQGAGLLQAGWKGTAVKTAVQAGKAAKLAGTGSALGAGAKSLLSSGAGLGTVAALAGAGLKKWAADDDPTTADWGDVGGSALSAAGTGMAIGSVIPGIGTAIGGIVGGLYGAGKSIFGAKKARKAKREQEAKIKAEKDKYNKAFNERMGAQQSNVRAGALKQKTYSGYDLGRNISAQLGGLRMGTPRY